MPCTCVSFQMGIMKLVSVSVNIFITSVRAGERYSDIFHTDIADVTHFVKPGTPLDEEAAIRGTTVYLVNKRVDMLPALLGNSKFRTKVACKT